ncbi:MAG: hypothetical protein H7255_10400 [Ramlibacter sp.]|nr:hypothetical protein [Ramlibacter sp.]
MNRFGLMIFAALSVLAHGSVFAGDSLLRIHCDDADADAGAEIDINGKFRGECPLDIKVKPGPLKLRVHKPVDRSRERVFELELRMGEDSVKKIDAEAPQLICLSQIPERLQVLRMAFHESSGCFVAIPRAD